MDTLSKTYSKHELIHIPTNGKVALTKWKDISSSVPIRNGNNVAILTGERNRITVIDIDIKNDGLKKWNELIKENGDITTPKVKTGSGGFHYYFRYNANIKTTSNVQNYGIDIRNDKAYVVAPPSVHSTGNTYKWILDLNTPFADVPQWLVDFIQAKPKPFSQCQKEPLPQYESHQYKKLNNLLQMPETTSWKVIKKEKSHQAVPDCFECLVQPSKVHSTKEHSTLFINKDKSVMKACFSCGAVLLDKSTSKKVLQYFKIVLQTHEENVFISLKNRLLDIGLEHSFKKQPNTGLVYKQVKPYAYIPFMPPKEFLNKYFLDDPDFSSNVNNLDNLIKFMKDFNHSNFPFLVIDSDYIGFTNGILNITNLEFYEDYDCSDIVVKKYIDQPFAYSMDTPLFDKVLDFQFSSEVRDFIYACLGRIFKIQDNFGLMLYLLGEAGCGKSVIINIIKHCCANIGVLNESYEVKYGISYFADKDVILCDDLPKNIDKIFPQQTFQTMITNGSVGSAVKNKDAITIDKWNIPLLFAGNWFPSYLDKGQISRRLLVANFERSVPECMKDTSLEAKIIQSEIPAFIYKSLSHYHHLLLSKPNRSIWDICPSYFVDQQDELRIERNPLYKFLTQSAVFKQDTSLSIKEIKDAFSSWLDKPITKLDNGTFAQVHSGFVIESTNICKHCENKHVKDCCQNYNRTQRTKRTIVKNIAWL